LETKFLSGICVVLSVPKRKDATYGRMGEEIDVRRDPLTWVRIPAGPFRPFSLFKREKVQVAQKEKY